MNRVPRPAPRNSGATATRLQVRRAGDTARVEHQEAGALAADAADVHLEFRVVEHGPTRLQRAAAESSTAPTAPSTARPTRDPGLTAVEDAELGPYRRSRVPGFDGLVSTVVSGSSSRVYIGFANRVSAIAGSA